MKNRTAIIAASLTVGLIAGCGGASTPATPAKVSGAVADGYLVGATVFLDKNDNYRLDEGEPSTTTDDSGAYTLNVDPADLGNYPIVALAIKGVTVDKDTNLPVQHSYLLSMPKESVNGTVSSNFISPMSTQIRELMATETYTMQQAMDEMRRQLGLPSDVNVMGNYMMDPDSANSRDMHTAAQNMAGLMGSQMAQVMSGSGPTANVDVNRYRGMMGAIFTNMSSLRGTNPNSSADMSNMMSNMTADLRNMAPGQPFRNMSSAFRGGMMSGGAGGGTRGGMGSGTGTSGGSMM